MAQCIGGLEVIYNAETVAAATRRAFADFDARHPMLPDYGRLVGAATLMLRDVATGGFQHIDPNVISNFAIRLHWDWHVAAVRERLLEGRRAECRRWWNR